MEPTMKPSEISLFTAKEQTLLVSTEAKRLDGVDEDELADLLTRVRRARKKYTDLDRRQSTEAIKAAGRRSVSSSSGERTLRKAEIFEDSVARVARALSRTARDNAAALKRERLDAAQREATSPKRTAKRDTTADVSTSAGKKKRPVVAPARTGATSAANKQSQARTDSRKTSGSKKK